MVNLFVKLLVAFLFSLFTINTSAQKIQCHLKGEVIDRPESNILYLYKKDGDFRILKIEIPIINNHFDYLLICDYEEAYELSFKDEVENGSWRPIEFMTENGGVHFKLYPMDRSVENVIIGGCLNTGKNNLEQLKDSLFERKIISNAISVLEKDKKMYSPQVYSLMDVFHDGNENTQDSVRTIISHLQKENNYYSTETYELIDKQKNLEKESILWEIEYLKNNLSLVSYTQLISYIKKIKQLQEISERGMDTRVEHLSFLKSEALFDIYKEKYKKKYPNHPYTELVEIAYNVFYNIKSGKKFIDFEALSFDGETIKLSEQIGGKVALIDLWASWCGPCRRNSMQIIPIYEKYKERGFTVVGVAREENSKHAINAAKQDGYPWLNLLELNDKNRIWEKYGVGNAGGATFLVDRDGSILAINPKTEDIEKILEAKLN